MSIRDCVVCDADGRVIDRLRHARLPGWNFHHAATPGVAESLVRQHDCLVGLMDVGRHSDAEACAVESMLARCPAEWIAVVDRSGIGIPSLERLIGSGFHDFHTLPLDLQRLTATIGHAYGKAAIRRRSRLAQRPADCFGMVGHSPAMRELHRRMIKVVRASASVLLSGESGTGKELVARAIHRHSARHAGPFIAINCGALPGSLIQSELFGYEKGAFTGALRNKVGGIEAAHGGVLFLDEIADLPLDQQTNLLRFLQEKAITRVGSTQHVDVDARVIAATNVDLQKAVDSGRFRADLFYRLNVLHLELPPLRARGNDIGLLAEHAFAALESEKSPQVRGFSAEALQALAEHDWPGNVRELINRVQQAMILSENRLITPTDLGLRHERRTVETIRLQEARASVDRDLLERTLRRHRNNVSQAARQLGVSRVTVYRLMSRHNITL